MKITTIGIDLAKEVFQIHGVDMHGSINKSFIRPRTAGGKSLAITTSIFTPNINSMSWPILPSKSTSMLR